MGYDVAIVGTGPDPSTRDRTGFAMAYRHAAAYERRSDCRLAACVDIERDHAEAFAEHHGLYADMVFEDHERMLREAEPDVISVCTPPAAHADIVTDCADAGSVRAIHCEKPMATSWDACREMVAQCAAADVQLTIGHQRRFSKPISRAKDLLDAGEIGALRRVEWAEVNLLDAGTHLFDLCDLFVDGAASEWILAAVDVSEDTEWFGTRNSSRALAHWAYENGVHGIASTADGDETAYDAYLRLVGDAGEIEVQPARGPPLRVRSGNGWRTVDTDGEHLYGPTGSRIRGAMAKLDSVLPGREPDGPSRPNYGRAIDHAVECLSTGREPTTSGATALRGSELIFGAWESARRRSRVDLPLDDVSNPLDALTENVDPPTQRA